MIKKDMTETKKRVMIFRTAFRAIKEIIFLLR
jgi:hypothetical protein